MEVVNDDQFMAPQADQFMADQPFSTVFQPLADAVQPLNLAVQPISTAFNTPLSATVNAVSI